MSNTNRIQLSQIGQIASFFFIFWIGILTAFSATAQGKITLEVGKSEALEKTDEVQTVFIADTSIADAQVSEGNRVFVFGKAVGQTTMITTSLDGSVETSYTIVVKHPLTELRAALGRRFPGQSISLESSRGSIFVAGSVSDESLRENIVATIQGIAPGVSIIDRVVVRQSNIIRLQVKLLEVNRTRSQSFGFDLNGAIANNGFFLGTRDRGVLTFGRSDTVTDNLNASIDLLVSNKVASVTQEKTLSTVTGETAEFSVGSEIPVPDFVSDNDGAEKGNFKLSYRFIGTELKFTPRRAPGEKLQMLIESSISAPTGTSATVNGNQFPNLSRSSFSTKVELRDAQPFIIAGLSRVNASADLRQSDGSLGSTLVDATLGSDAETNNTQELIVIVTPFLGEKEKTQPAVTRLPEVTSNLQYIFSGSGSIKKASTRKRAFGPAGFKY